MKGKSNDVGKHGPTLHEYVSTKKIQERMHILCQDHVDTRIQAIRYELYEVERGPSGIKKSNMGRIYRMLVPWANYGTIICRLGESEFHDVQTAFLVA